jgi:hypothetical protein
MIKYDVMRSLIFVLHFATTLPTTDYSGFICRLSLVCNFFASSCRSFGLSWIITSRSHTINNTWPCIHSVCTLVTLFLLLCVILLLSFGFFTFSNTSDCFWVASNSLYVTNYITVNRKSNLISHQSWLVCARRAFSDLSGGNFRTRRSTALTHIHIQKQDLLLTGIERDRFPLYTFDKSNFRENGSCTSRLLLLQCLTLSKGLQETCLKEVYVRFQVLTAASTKMAVFWVVAPCSLVEV